MSTVDIILDNSKKIEIELTGNKTEVEINSNTVANSLDIVSNTLQKATQEEVDLGITDSKYITPLKLKNRVFSDIIFTTLIGNNILTIFNISHNLNTVYANSIIYSNVTNKYVIVETELIDNNSIKLSFSKPPLENEFKVTIFKI